MQYSEVGTILRDYSAVASALTLAASLASLVEGGKPHLCQEAEAAACQSLSLLVEMGRKEQTLQEGRNEEEGGGKGGKFPFHSLSRLRQFLSKLQKVALNS